MEDGFPILDEFDDEQALERQLESLLDDASDHLPVSSTLGRALYIHFFGGDFDHIPFFIE